MVSGLDSPHLLHAFYKWSCREFSEPASAGSAATAPLAAAAAGSAAAAASAAADSTAMNLSPTSSGDVEEWVSPDSRGKLIPVSAVPSGMGAGAGTEQEEEEPYHAHEFTDALGYDGALRLYFKRRNTRMHESSDVSFVLFFLFPLSPSSFVLEYRHVTVSCSELQLYLVFVECR